MGYIYNATNKINGKGYIGQTIRPIKERLKEHQQESRNCRAFSSAIKKYGWKNFVIDFYECPDDELNKHEKWMVNLMGTLSPGGYNLREGGGSGGKWSEESKRKLRESQSGDKNHNYGKKGEKSPLFGKTHTEETKQKQSDAKKGERHPSWRKPRSKETKQKIREARLGTTRSEETKQKCRKAQLGKKHSEETIQKRREANSGDNNHMSKRVYQYDLDGNFIDSFGSTGEAGRYLKKDATGIKLCASYKRKTAHKFKWSYTMNIFI